MFMKAKPRNIAIKKLKKKNKTRGFKIFTPTAKNT